MLILINGMPRSGSTFSFNIAREILARRGSVTWVASDQVEMGILESSAESVIVKSHNPNTLGLRLVQTGAMKGICTIRDPLEAIESWMDMFGFNLDQSITAFQAWFRSYKILRDYTFIIEHREIEKNPKYVIWKIARQLGVLLPPRELFFLARKYSRVSVKAFSAKLEKNDPAIIDVGFSHFEKDTFFHRRHVRDCKKGILSNEERKKLESILSAPEFKL